MSCHLLLLVHALIVFCFIGGVQTESRHSLTEVAKATGCKDTAIEIAAEVASTQLDCLFEKWYTEIAPNATDMGRAGTYGEITPKGVATVFSMVGQLGAGEMGPEDNFFDLGSGLGKMVLQASLTTSVGRAIGVELDKDRLSMADIALGKLRDVEEQLAAVTSPAASRAGFLQGDIRDTEVWKNATVVYMSSLCFSPSMMLELSGLLARTLQPGSVVFSLTPLPGCHRGLRRLGAVRASMSWTEDFEVNVYVLPPIIARPPTWASFSDDGKDVVTASLPEAEDTYLVESCVTNLSGAMHKPIFPAIRRACTAAGLPGQAEHEPKSFLATDGVEAPTAMSVDNVKDAMMHVSKGHYSTASRCLLSDLEALADEHVDAADAKRLGEEMFGSNSNMASLGMPGQTVLHVALKKNLEMPPKVLQALLERRVDLQIREEQGRLPLSLAAQQGHAATVSKLLQHRADVDGIDDKEKTTALHYAVLSFKPDIVRGLLNSGAQVNIKDSRGVAPLHNLWTRGGIPSALRRVPGSKFAKQAEEHRQIAEMLLAHRADVNALDGSGKSLLHYLAVQGEEDMVEPLLRARADLSLPDKMHNTPLHGSVARVQQNDRAERSW